MATGANGMLCRDLQRVLPDRSMTALARGDLDVTDADAVERAVTGYDSSKVSDVVQWCHDNGNWWEPLKARAAL